MVTLEPLVKARCNMFAVLRNIEYLAEQDEESRRVLENTRLGIGFQVKNAFSAFLSFKDGGAKLTELGPGRKPPEKRDIHLFFTSADHFNRMIDGKANPLPLKGLSKLSFLKGPFTRITDTLEKYLRADDEALKNEETFRKNTEMTAYTAFFALAEIANYDPEGKTHGASIPNGVLQIEVGEGPELWIYVCDGVLTAHKGRHPEPRAVLSFKNLEAAHAMLKGSRDTYTSVGLGLVEIRGFVPMIEHLNPVLNLVSRYLA